MGAAPHPLVSTFQQIRKAKTHGGFTRALCEDLARASRRDAGSLLRLPRRTSSLLVMTGCIALAALQCFRASPRKSVHAHRREPSL